MASLIVEGPWEDVRAHEAEFLGQWVRVEVLPNAATGQASGGSAETAEQTQSQSGLTDELTDLLRKTAAASGEDFSVFMARWGKKYGTPRRVVTQAERVEGVRRLWELTFAGGTPMGVDNEQIDRELADAYAHGLPEDVPSER